MSMDDEVRRRINEGDHAVMERNALARENTGLRQRLAELEALARAVTRWGDCFLRSHDGPPCPERQGNRDSGARCAVCERRSRGADMKTWKDYEVEIDRQLQTLKASIGMPEKIDIGAAYLDPERVLVMVRPEVDNAFREHMTAQAEAAGEFPGALSGGDVSLRRFWGIQVHITTRREDPPVRVFYAFGEVPEAIQAG